MHSNSCHVRNIAHRRTLPAILLLVVLVPVSASLSFPAAGDPAAPPPLPARTEAEVLVILAHPDDEGTLAPLLARYALEEKRVVVNVYVTSGRNGTNRSGAARGPAFGLVRLTELHWTLDHLGVAMFHTLHREDAVEAEGDPAGVLEAWNREETVGELVRLIRLLKPREVITWVPGPPSGHIEHAAAGGAALLACRAAGSAEAFPEHLLEEGLQTWRVPEVFMVAQPEKVGYARAPKPIHGELSAARLRVETLDAVSPTLGLRYTDIAREAMKEQRAVAMVNNQNRGGPFDEPLHLLRVFVEPLPGRSGGARLSLRTHGSQRFFELLSAEVGDPDLSRLFPAEVVVPQGSPGLLSVEVGNVGASRLRATVALELPPGWKARPSRHRISLDSGSSEELQWRLSAPSGVEPGHVAASLLLSRSGGEKVARPLALRVWAPDSSRDEPPKTR